MRTKTLSATFAALSLALGLVVAPASFAHGASATSATQSSQQVSQRSGSKQNQSNPNEAADAHSGWWNNQSTSSSNCAKSFSQLDQCSV